MSDEEMTEAEEKEMIHSYLQQFWNEMRVNGCNAIDVGNVAINLLFEAADCLREQGMPLKAEELLAEARRSLGERE